MASPSYSKLLEPVGDVIAGMEAILSGGFGETTGDQRECCKRVHAHSWGVHTLVMDVITAIGIENAATRPAVLDRYQSLMEPIHVDLENLVAGYDGFLTHEQLPIADQVLKSVAAIERMIHNLWLYSLLRHGKLQAQRKVFDSASLTGEVKSILPRVAMAGAGPLRLLGDENWLRSALGEISRNVWQHGDASRVQLDLRQSQRQAVFTLRDAGAGFGFVDSDQPFGAFWQADEDTEGLGLGLYLARSWIEQSGGGIAISSARGRGTTVQIWLRAAA